MKFFALVYFGLFCLFVRIEVICHNQHYKKLIYRQIADDIYKDFRSF